MKFIADAMLGKLAKRLRLLGFDVHYDHALDDNDIIRISHAQDRVILTRDSALAARPLAKNNLLIRSDHPEDQVRQILDRFAGAATPAPLTRCSVCNAPLTALEKAAARDRVPQHIYDTTETFLECRQCGRVYWKGTHVARMSDEDR